MQGGLAHAQYAWEQQRLRCNSLSWNNTSVTFIFDAMEYFLENGEHVAFSAVVPGNGRWRNFSMRRNTQQTRGSNAPCYILINANSSYERVAFTFNASDRVFTIYMSQPQETNRMPIDASVLTTYERVLEATAGKQQQEFSPDKQMEVTAMVMFPFSTM